MHFFKQYVENKKVSLNLKKKRPKETKQSKDNANGQEGRDEGDEQGRAVGGVGD